PGATDGARDAEQHGRHRARPAARGRAMNSVHDMGGVDGFGPVRPEADEPVFHAPWEGRVQALSRALGPVGMGTIDHSRAMMEAMDPVEYLTVSYMKRRFLGIERRLLAKGLVTPEELAA